MYMKPHKEMQKFDWELHKKNSEFMLFKKHDSYITINIKLKEVYFKNIITLKFEEIDIIQRIISDNFFKNLV